MTIFLTIGVIGIVLLLAAILIGDHVDGILDALGGGEWFTGAALSGFLGALGFIGALVLDQTDNMALAVALGAAAGLLVGALVGWVTLRLRNVGDGSTPRAAELVGRTGIVISDIPADGFGEIRVSNAGHLAKLNARADRALPAGTEVWIVENLSPTSVRVQSTRDQ